MAPLKYINVTFRVKLVINKTSGDSVAMKVVDLAKGGNSVKSSVEKEVKIHKFLKDKHIIRCYGSRQQSNFFYIFLEYAPHGELFDRIGEYYILPFMYILLLDVCSCVIL